MPLDGLPKALESMLTILLQENDMSSFKIETAGSKTVVVLRLQSTTSGHDPVNNTATTYRRKCPSQVYRDRKRAETFRNETIKNQASAHHSAMPTSPLGLFMPTPPSLMYRVDTDFEASRPIPDPVVTPPSSVSPSAREVHAPTLPTATVFTEVKGQQISECVAQRDGRPVCGERNKSTSTSSSDPSTSDEDDDDDNNDGWDIKKITDAAVKKAVELFNQKMEQMNIASATSPQVTNKNTKK